jgi:hypothetical protein
MLTFKQWCWTVLRFSGALAIVGVAVWGWKKIARSRKPAEDSHEPTRGGSFDDVVDLDLEGTPPIACDECGEAAAKPAIGGFIFEDIKTCPKCGRIGCKHWCDGKSPCEWCVSGEPDDFVEREQS